MAQSNHQARQKPEDRPELAKAPTGIEGFDLITRGGLPRGRPSLVCGGPGCGKTLFGVTFLAKGATLFDEPGVFVTFEEKASEIATNVASLGYNLDELCKQKKLAIDHVFFDPRQIEESGEYDLEGLFVRLEYAINSVGAKRVVLDTIESLFSGFTNLAILRSELRRLFGWLKDRGVTAIITGERGDGTLTRQGLEEYVSDCVILLDVVAHEQIVTRRIQVVKYRGTAHGTNQYPFLIDHDGINVLPITASGLEHARVEGVVSTGVPTLDKMLAAGGVYRGSSVMISGPAGTGKTTFASTFAASVCAGGERCLYFAFEEAPPQIMRNMTSVSVDLRTHVDSGKLVFSAARPSTFGFEMHLARMNRDLDQFNPSCVVVDPISAFRGENWEVHATLLRMVDLLKSRGMTAVFTRLTSSQEIASGLEQGISSLIDTWILLADLEVAGERSRGLHVIKSRGMSHSHQVQQYVLQDGGIKIIPGAFEGRAPRLRPPASVAAAAVAKKAKEKSKRSKKSR
jgi:circadian clock protein KaiC